MEDKLEKGNITFTALDTGLFFNEDKNGLVNINQVINNYCDGYSLDIVYKVLSEIIINQKRCHCCKNYNLKCESCCTNINNISKNFKLDMSKVIKEYNIDLTK